MTPKVMELVLGLNEDLKREYQAILAYNKHFAILKGSENQWLAEQLQEHANQEQEHAQQLTKWIDYYGGIPETIANAVPSGEDFESIVNIDIQLEKNTIEGYKDRIKQAMELEEYGLVDALQDIFREENDHLLDLSTSIGKSGYEA